MFNARRVRVMTVILPPDYHARRALQQAGAVCIRPEDAERQDIRPLRIGISNVMPKAESYEFSLWVARSNTWRSHRNEFFSQWLKFIHDAVSFRFRSHLPEGAERAPDPPGVVARPMGAEK
jgi:homoserine trans-succinylase